MDVEESPSLMSVSDRPAEHRLVVERDGWTAELVYRVDGDRIVLVHTGVPEAMSGQGIGSMLVRAALDRAADEGLTVVPWCAFARRWLREHPDAAASVNIDWESQPPGRRRTATATGGPGD